MQANNENWISATEYITRMPQELKDAYKELANKIDWYAYFQKHLDFIEQNNVHISKEDKAKLIEQRDSCKKPQVKCI